MLVSGNTGSEACVRAGKYRPDIYALEMRKIDSKLDRQRVFGAGENI